ncbi:MAG TPA: spermidine/putrescine ABC transporter ATP-binding protein, partial [Lachnoclostridium sp.]|nr:spermidine/putrescine ABC transporter ATP-binding protein [Lachnoclostridium sp.]
SVVRKPKVFLMDEPLSNLDAKLRTSTRAEIVKLQRELKVTTVYVTHDQTEAMTMADRMVVLKDGIIQQAGTPNEIYYEPCNLFVAGFIGASQMNFIEGRVEGSRFVFGSHAL